MLFLLQRPWRQREKSTKSSNRGLKKAIASCLSPFPQRRPPPSFSGSILPSAEMASNFASTSTYVPSPPASHSNSTIHLQSDPSSSYQPPPPRFFSSSAPSVPSPRPKRKKAADNASLDTWIHRDEAIARCFGEDLQDVVHTRQGELDAREEEGGATNNQAELSSLRRRWIRSIRPQDLPLRKSRASRDLGL